MVVGTHLRHTLDTDGTRRRTLGSGGAVVHRHAHPAPSPRKRGLAPPVYVVRSIDISRYISGIFDLIERVVNVP